MVSQFSMAVTAGAVAYISSFALAAQEARGASETVLYSFQGWPSDGAVPTGGLLYRSGLLYGTTTNGGNGFGCTGPINCGTFYSITLSGTETPLHVFGHVNGDGANPQAGFIEAGGVFYGTTSRRQG